MTKTGQGAKNKPKGVPLKAVATFTTNFTCQAQLPYKFFDKFSVGN